jgi:hypothetical protein
LNEAGSGRRAGGRAGGRRDGWFHWAAGGRRADGRATNNLVDGATEKLVQTMARVVSQTWQLKLQLITNGWHCHIPQVYSVITENEVKKTFLIWWK